MISVDSTKKEDIGRYSNGGAAHAPNGDPEATDTHDVIGALAKVAPYGIDDVAKNTGWVNVGTDADTGEFAVESIRRWWAKIGRPCYPDATNLLITADDGGSNGSRLRLWRAELAKRATKTGLTITVRRLAPRTSKWNKIEHRRFSAITMNGRGRPVETHEVAVETIAATTTKTGLTIQAGLDTNPCDKRMGITDQQVRAFEASHLQRQDLRGGWNHAVRATPHENTTPPEPQDQTARKRPKHRTGTPARRTTGDPHAGPHLPWSVPSSHLGRSGRSNHSTWALTRSRRSARRRLRPPTAPLRWTTSR